MYILNINIFVYPGWEFVREFLLENLIQQQDLGASVAVYHQGYPIVNLRGGWFDESQTKPYDDETLQLVFSTTKGVVAMAVALCVQRGLLDYSELVTKYWPEYGKENTTVADILSHRAGLPYASSPISQYTNWTAMIQTLEEEKPLWIPGTDHGYHSVTYGWLVGELVRRVDPKKRSFGEFFQDEIDLVLLYYSSFGMGFHRFYYALPDFSPNVFGHHGAGGSIGFAAPEKNLSFAYAMNRVGTDTATIIDPRIKLLLNEIAKKINF